MNALERYRASHTHPMNHATHAVGIPMIVVSLVLLFFNLKWAAILFVLGWILQFIGHAFEGKPPVFLSDPRALVVALYWWAKKVFGRP